MFLSIMLSNECVFSFAGCVIYFNKSMNHSMYVDLGFIERIAAITSINHFAMWGNKEDTDFDNFMI